MDYIHFNPVKHGYVATPSGWPHSSFLEAVQGGYYSADWGKEEPKGIAEVSLD